MEGNISELIKREVFPKVISFEKGGSYDNKKSTLALADETLMPQSSDGEKFASSGYVSPSLTGLTISDNTSTENRIPDKKGLFLYLKEKEKANSEPQNWEKWKDLLIKFGLGEKKGRIELLCRLDLYKVTIHFNLTENIFYLELSDEDLTLPGPYFTYPVDFKEVIKYSIILDGGIILLPSDDEKNKQEGLIKNMGGISINDTEYINRTVRKHQIKVARAAIMSRNMSHNLGSHVMFYLKQRLCSVEEIINTGALMELIQAHSIEELAEIKKINRSEMPFLVGLGRFLNYLQERQDYIATISTDYIPYKSTINFKDSIYDELKPELKHQRHKGDAVGKDAVGKDAVGKEAANLLLQYIAYSEGFKESKQIELCFGEFDGTNAETVPNELRQLNVALPGGNLGRQAFFSIMENIIRNTAKHDGAAIKKGGSLRFRFDLLTDCTNISDYTNNAEYSKDITYIYRDNSNKYYYLGITIDDILIKDDTLEKIGEGLNRPYIYDNGRMDDEYKGIKEMRISAAWMRGYGIDTDIPVNEPPALAIRSDGERLQYIICLSKPHKIAVICDKDTPLDKNGNQFFSSDNINEKIKSIADFDLIVCTEKDKDAIRKYVGSRILVMNSIDIKVGDDFEHLYMEWLHQIFREQLPKLKLIINDSKSFDSKKGIDEDLKSLVICNGGEPTSEVTEPVVLFSKHYDGKDDNIKKIYPNRIFLEGVSGGNSTDRLIRNERWTKEWYVKQMTAGLIKVAIFDERIYGDFVKYENNSEFADWDEQRLSEWLIDLKKKYNSVRIKRCDVERELNEVFSEHITIYDLCEKISDSDRHIALNPNDTVLKNAIKKLKESSTPPDYSIAALYAEKGIWAFDICRTDESSVAIKGIYQEKEEIVAKIVKNEETGVKCELLNNFNDKFDFISVHQGILDKIYVLLDVRSIEERMKVTKAIFDGFSKLSASDDLLPQFIIHSGRSHPTKSDMPQKQPFIQFAALDHAVRDCKYTLTELLYTAHYE